MPSLVGPDIARQSSQRRSIPVPVLHIRREEIEKKLRQEKLIVLWLARKIEPEQGHRLEQLSIDGIEMVMEGRRFYPKVHYLPMFWGSSVDGIGLEGLERRYETQLHGEKRMTILQRDALGRTVFQGAPRNRTCRRACAHADNRRGHSIHRRKRESWSRPLTILVRNREPSSSWSPKAERSWAMAVGPRFRSNAVAAYRRSLWNRALTDLRAGSTMKVVVAAAALEERVMDARLHVVRQKTAG